MGLHRVGHDLATELQILNRMIYRNVLVVCVSHSVVFNSVRPHGLQHTRLPCPSPSPGVCSNSCPWSWWCHPTISSSVTSVYYIWFHWILLYIFNKDGNTWRWSRSVVSDSLQHHELQHIKLPCPSLSPGVCSNSYPLSWWCHPTISSSVVPFLLALNLSQYQGLLQWAGSSHQVAQVL